MAAAAASVFVNPNPSFAHEEEDGEEHHHYMYNSPKVIIIPASAGSNTKSSSPFAALRQKKDEAPNAITVEHDAAAVWDCGFFSYSLFILLYILYPLLP